MIRIVAAVFIAGLWCLHQQALGQIPNVKIVGFGKIIPPPTITPQGQSTKVVSASSTTFTAMDIGTAAADRYVIAACNFNNVGTSLAVTIGGVSATIAKKNSAFSNPTASLSYALVPTGTTADVVVNVGGTTTRWGCSTFRMVGWQGSNLVTNSNQNSTSMSANLTLPSRGSAVATSSWCTNTTIKDPAISVTWTGPTEYQDTFFSFSNSSSAYASLSGSGLSISYSTNCTAASNATMVTAGFYN